MKKLVEFFNDIGIVNDKWMHFIMGALIALIFGWYKPIGGIMMSVGAGVIKEVYDFVDYGLFDIKDMLATWAGGVIITIVLVVLQYNHLI